MELSPLAREKLAKIGDLTREEKEKLRNSEQLTPLLADYFTGKIRPEDLWQELKKQKDAGKEPMVKEAQARLIDAMSLSSADADFARARSGILALETIKESGNYTTLELRLNSLETLRQQYRQEREKTYNTLRASVERQVRQASQQLAAQAQRNGTAFDFQGSIEATTKSSPEWRSFLTRHEENYLRKLREQLAQLRSLL